MAVLLLHVVGLAHCDQEDATDCSEYVDALAKHDIFLNGRKELATELINNGSTAGQFVKDMKNKAKSAAKYQCGNTRFWIDGIYMGTPHQYEELRLASDGYGVDAGFQDVMGNNKTRDLFSKYADLEGSLVLYKFQTFGALDHVWAVLQVPGPKYKVFQSYNMAYSLYAWMSSQLNGLFVDGHIRYWDDVRSYLKAYLEKNGGQLYDNGTITFPANTPPKFQEWARYIVDYNQTMIEANLVKAWDKFGQNKLLDKTPFMTDYVDVLQKLMDATKPLVNTAAVWTQELHDQWISLFGSPNPVCYPGVPFNTLTADAPQQTLELQVRVEIVEMERNSCQENYMEMGNTIPGWVDPLESLTAALVAQKSTVFLATLVISLGYYRVHTRA